MQKNINKTCRRYQNNLFNMTSKSCTTLNLNVFEHLGPFLLDDNLENIDAGVGALGVLL